MLFIFLLSLCFFLKRQIRLVKRVFSKRWRFFPLCYSDAVSVERCGVKGKALLRIRRQALFAARPPVIHIVYIHATLTLFPLHARHHNHDNGAKGYTEMLWLSELASEYRFFFFFFKLML